MTFPIVLRQFAVALAAAISLTTVWAAQAQQPAPATPAKSSAAAPVILIVDYQKVVRDAEGAKSVRQQIDTYRQNFQKEISAKETDLAAKQQELSKQSTVMSAEALTTKRKEFEQQVGEVQRMAIIRGRMLDEAYGKAMNDFNSVLQSIVDRLATERRRCLRSRLDELHTRRACSRVQHPRRWPDPAGTGIWQLGARGVSRTDRPTARLHHALPRSALLPADAGGAHRDCSYRH